MLSHIVTAAENFCTHQMRKTYSFCPDIPKMRMFIAYIDIVEQKNTHRVYIAISQKLLQYLCEIFLFEEDCDDLTLQDMLLETTNMIVGNAKVLAQEGEDRSYFTIQTPHFSEVKKFNEVCDSQITLKIKNSKLLLAIKENYAT